MTIQIHLISTSTGYWWLQCWVSISWHNVCIRDAVLFCIPSSLLVFVCVLVLCASQEANYVTWTWSWTSSPKKESYFVHFDIAKIIIPNHPSIRFRIWCITAPEGCRLSSSTERMCSWALNPAVCPSFCTITSLVHLVHSLHKRPGLNFHNSSWHAVIKSLLVDLLQRYANSFYSLSFSFAAQVLDTWMCQS